MIILLRNICLIPRISSNKDCVKKEQLDILATINSVLSEAFTGEKKNKNLVFYKT